MLSLFICKYLVINSSRAFPIYIRVGSCEPYRMEQKQNMGKGRFLKSLAICALLGAVSLTPSADGGFIACKLFHEASNVHDAFL